MAQQYDSDGDPVDPDSGARFGWSSLADVRPLRADGTPMSPNEVSRVRAYLNGEDDPATPPPPVMTAGGGAVPAEDEENEQPSDEELGRAFHSSLREGK